MMNFCQQLQEGIREEVPTPFQDDGTPHLVGDMVDNHVKEKVLPPPEDEFLDALGPNDNGLKGLFKKLPPIMEDHLVALVSGVRSKSQQLTASSPQLSSSHSLPNNTRVHLIAKYGLRKLVVNNG
jgi:hypothetical protein